MTPSDPARAERLAHVWRGPTKFVRWTHCRACGIIRRADGRNSPECKGAPRIGFRARSDATPGGG